LEPYDWKPMASIGTGVQEIRIQTEAEHRVFYVVRFLEGIYVLHAFEKRSRKTSRFDVALARVRYRELLEYRRRERYAKD